MQRHVKNFLIAFVIVFALGPAVFLALYTDRYAKAGLEGLALKSTSLSLSLGTASMSTAGQAVPGIPVLEGGLRIQEERKKWDQIILSGLENAAYGFLKGLSRKIAIEMAQGAVKTIAIGATGKEPLFYTKPWDQYLKEASLDAAGFFLEGAVQGWKDADFVEKLKKDQDLAEKLENVVLPDLKGKKEKTAEALGILSGEFETLKAQEITLQDELRNCPSDATAMSRCGIKRQQLSALKDKIRQKEAQVVQTRTASSQADQAYSQAETELPSYKKRSEEAKKTYAQIPQEVLDRRLKYQEGDQQGGFSEEARNVIATACNPNQLFLLNLTIGLGFTKSSDLRPTCNLEEAYNNWHEAFQNSTFYNVPMRELLSSQANGWKTAQSMINPFGEPDLAVAFKLNLISDKVDEERSLAAKLARTGATPFKPITTLGGIIKTPGEVVKFQTEQQLGAAHNFDSRIYNKMEVDLADIALTFTESLLGRLGEIWMEGLQYASPELAYQGASLRAGFTGNKLIYSQGALPVFNRDQAIEVRTARLAKLDYSRGTTLNLLAEFQSTNTNGIHSRLIDRAFAQAITQRLTLEEALKKYEQTGGTIGINPNGIFGFKVNSTAASPVEPDIEKEKGFPYRSMVILRKYRVIPVSWELTALYIKKNPDICGVGGCTIRYVMDQFNQPTSPFYRLVDPLWVLKLPPVRCELEGYGPPVPGESQRPACLFDTNGDGIACCQIGCLTQDWLRSPGYTFLVEKLAALKESCAANKDTPLILTDDEKEKITNTANHPLKEYIQQNNKCSVILYGDPNTSERKKYPGILDEEEIIQRRAKTCVDEQTCLFEDGKGECEDRGYGYCLEERKRWDFKGTQCKPIYQSCDVFTDTISNESNYYLRDKLPDDNIQRDAQGNVKGNICSAQNAGCGWYSSTRNVGPALDRQVFVTRGGRGGQTTVPKLEDGKPVFAIQEWDTTKRAYLSAKAKTCTEDNEGCTKLTCPDGDSECLVKAARENRPTQAQGDPIRDRYFKIAPEYYKCALTDPLIDKKPSYKRTECKPFALNCTQEFEGCQRYQATNGDPSVAAPRSSLQICKQECSGLSSFVKTATDFEAQEPATTNDLIAFIPTKVQMCPSTEVGCDEFTNLDKKEQGGESLEYYSHLQACEKTPAEPTVFYTYYGSDTSGYKPEKVFLKPNGAHPACASGGTDCECDESTFTSQKASPNSSFTCREFINAAGGKSYRHWDKVVYQADDCHPYRRTLDGANGQVRYATQQFGLSKTCSAQNKGCREYKSGRAGNVWVPLYDNFENKTTTDWDIKHPVQYSAVPSSEAETLDNTSLLLEARENQTPDTMELKKKVDITLGASYQFMLGVKANAGNKLTVKLIREANNAQTNEVVFGTVPILNDSWQHVKFFAPHVTFDALKTEGGFVVITLEKGTGTLPKVLLDDIALKKMEGVVYAINSSTINERAFPTSCHNTTEDSVNLSKQLNCQEYKTPQGKQEYFSAVGKLCPTELVGCKKFMQEQTSVYIVDDQSKLCPRTEEFCTAYGKPVLANKIDGSEKIMSETVNSTRMIDGTAKQVVQKTYQWKTAYYKVTSQQATDGTAALSASPAPSAETLQQIYDKGICKAEENGCRAYDTQFASKRFFLKGGGKILCSAKEVGSTLSWVYQTCTEQNDINKAKDATISCESDKECETLFGDGSKCAIENSCPQSPDNGGMIGSNGTTVTGQKTLFKKQETTHQLAVGDSISAQGQTHIITAIQSDTSLTTDTAFSPALSSGTPYTFKHPTEKNYIYACNEQNVGCRKITDPECVLAKRCGGTTIRCDEKPDGFCNEQAQITRGSNGTCSIGNEEYVYRDDYGRNIQDVACTPEYYYMGDVVSDAQNKLDKRICNNSVDVEKGCLLFEDSNSETNKYNSKDCYSQYFGPNKNTFIPQFQSSCQNGQHDSNAIFSVKLDRECRTWLACVASEEVPNRLTGKNEIRCTMRVPCRKKDSGGSECDGTGILYRPGKVKRDEAALKSRFLTPFSQGGANADDFSFSMLSGLSRPDFEFKEYANYQKFITSDAAGFKGHDGYFLPGGKESDKGKWLENVVTFQQPKPQPQNSQQSCYTIPFINVPICNPVPQQSVAPIPASQTDKIGILGIDSSSDPKQFIVNSCRLYPDEFAPIWRRGKAVDACDYTTGGEEQKGVYGYCLEPYPEDKKLNGFGDFPSEFIQNSSSKEFDEKGKRTSYGYPNYCLNWYPKEQTLIQAVNTTSGDTLKAFDVADTDNGYYCVEEETTGATKKVAEHSHITLKGVDARKTEVESDWRFNRNLWLTYLPLWLAGKEVDIYASIIGVAMPQNMKDEVTKWTANTPGLNIEDVLAFRMKGASIGSMWKVPRNHQLGDTKGLYIYSELDKPLPNEMIDNRKDDISQFVPARDEEKISRDKILAIEYKLEYSTRQKDDGGGGKDFADWKNHEWQIRTNSDTAAEKKDFTFLLRDLESNRDYQTCGVYPINETAIPFICDNVIGGVTADTLRQIKMCDGSSISKRSFIGIQPEFIGGVLKGWYWRYCDKDGSDGLELAYVSIKIHTYEKTTHVINHSFKRTYCKKFIRVSEEGKAITKFSRVYDKALSETSGTSEKITKETNKELFDHVTVDPSALNPEKNEFLRYGEEETYAPSPGQQVDGEFINKDAQKLQFKGDIEHSCDSGKTCIDPIVIEEDGKVHGGERDTIVAELPNGTKIPLAGMQLVGGSYTRKDLSYNPRTLLGTDRAKNYFAKQYGTWDWSGGYDGRYQSTNEDVLGWAATKVNANSFPVIRSLEKMKDPNDSTKEINIPNRFSTRAYHNGKSLSLSFFIEVNPDQLPLKQYVIDWGVVNSDDGKDIIDYMQENQNEVKEGRGQFDKKSTSVPVNPYIRTREWIYDVGLSLEGRVVCVYAVDNWGTKRAVCGKFVKTATGKFEIPDDKWCTKIGTYDTDQSELIRATKEECKNK